MKNAAAHARDFLLRTAPPLLGCLHKRKKKKRETWKWIFLKKKNRIGRSLALYKKKIQRQAWSRGSAACRFNLTWAESILLKKRKSTLFFFLSGDLTAPVELGNFFFSNFTKCSSNSIKWYISMQILYISTEILLLLCGSIFDVTTSNAIRKSVAINLLGV